MGPHPHVDQAVAGIRALLLDVDGVLTDGSIVYSDQGDEWKRFHVRDGAGIKIWQAAGYQTAILSGRASRAVERRARELGITHVMQGQSDKSAALDRILTETGWTASEVAAIGDDLPDLTVLSRVGVGIAVADACAEVRAQAVYTTVTPGGHGAVREAIEWLLTRQGRWTDLVNRYRPAG